MERPRQDDIVLQLDCNFLAHQSFEKGKEDLSKGTMKDMNRKFSTTLPMKRKQRRSAAEGPAESEET
jgi:hypothetical protein